MWHSCRADRNRKGLLLNDAHVPPKLRRHHYPKAPIVVLLATLPLLKGMLRTRYCNGLLFTAHRSPLYKALQLHVARFTAFRGLTTASSSPSTAYSVLTKTMCMKAPEA